MRRPTGPRTCIALLLVLLTFAPLPLACEPAGSASGGDTSREGMENPNDPGRMVDFSDVVFVSRAVDGDTIEIDETVDGHDEVRLIGVDAPETSHPIHGEQPFGQEAKQFVASRLEGEEVALEYDVEKTDRYGRLLAYVWLLDDAAMFNEVVLREGYAQVATFPPNVKHIERLREAQDIAKRENKGLWGLPEWQLCRQTDRGNGIGGGCSAGSYVD